MSITILNSIVSVTNIPRVVEQVETWVMRNQSIGQYICVFNVHMCMEAFDDTFYNSVVNDADMVVPDGRPIVWAQKILGERGAEQVRGLDLTIALCELATNKDFKIGIFGGDSNLIKLLTCSLQRRYPDLNLALKISPPFRPITVEENASYVQQINDSGVQILFVALGCPKQENWMAKQKNDLHCVMVGVGAAFDFIAGTKKNAPRWIQIMGLEWFFRFLCEPKRLWRRYLYNNPRFVWQILKQIL